MRRKTYLGDDVLKEVAGRLRFGATPLEDRLDNTPKPEPKPWSYPSHPLDKVAETYGMRGFEFKVLQEAALREMENHTILQHYYRRFLMAAKLVLDGELEKARLHERRQSEDRNSREAGYQEKLRQWESRNKQITKSWTAVRDTIRTRWGRMGRSLATLVEQDALMGTMDQRDQMFIDLLGGRGIVTTDLHEDIDQRRVLSIDWDAYADMSIEDINEVIHDLNGLPGGDFIPKLTVTKLEEPA